MKWLDRWFIKRITWVKPLTNLTLGELYTLRQKVDEEIKELWRNKYGSMESKSK